MAGEERDPIGGTAHSRAQHALVAEPVVSGQLRALATR